MRTRKDIEEDLMIANYDGNQTYGINDDVVLEVLLDIRDLLTKPPL